MNPALCCPSHAVPMLPSSCWLVIQVMQKARLASLAGDQAALAILEANGFRFVRRGGVAL